MAVFVSDTFTDVADTLLENHVGEVGATWTKNTVIYSGTLAISNANRVRNGIGDSNFAYYRASGTPAGEEYDIEYDFHNFTGAGACMAVFEASASQFTFYQAGINNDKWSVVQWNNGTPTVLGTDVGPLSLGVGDFHVKVTVRKSGANRVITIFQDGVQVHTVTDTSALPATGKVGINCYQDVNDALGYHGDNFVATDFVAGALPARPPLAPFATPGTAPWFGGSCKCP